ncbi:MAG: hypothetical protein NW202_08095 [Nitrospira sp.]|nr:hypothetical protein [Nitrospira sp.]
MLFLPSRGLGEGVAGTEESGSSPPDLRLSLRDAIQAAVDNNVNVRLLKERIAAAQAQADVCLAAFGLPAERLSGLGLTRSVTEPFESMPSRRCPRFGTSST